MALPAMLARRRDRYLTAFLIGWFALVSLAAEARAEGRWALVVGVAEYGEEAFPDLLNTVNDARTMAAALNDMGFEVYYRENPTRREMLDAVAQVAAEQAGAEVGFFYFAGHGLQP